MVLTGHYFCGQKISEYGIQNKRLDYDTLAKSINLIFANDFLEQTKRIGFWKVLTGNADQDIYQYYIVDESGAKILMDLDEIVYYNEELDLYVWGVTHYGTAWDYVLTDVKIEIQ